MTEYETKSLQIAIDTYHVYMGMLGAAIIGGLIAWFTLCKITRQLESGQWNALFLLEQEMNNQSRHLVEIFVSTTSEDRRRDEAIESYLNVVERLALAILKNQLPGSETKKIYCKFITSTVTSYKSKFEIGTDYPRIRELYEKWQD